MRCREGQESVSQVLQSCQNTGVPSVCICEFVPQVSKNSKVPFWAACNLLVGLFSDSFGGPQTTYGHAALQVVRELRKASSSTFICKLPLIFHTVRMHI